MNISQKKFASLLISLCLVALTVFPRCGLHLTRKAYFTEDTAKKEATAQEFYQFSEMEPIENDAVNDPANMARLSDIMQQEILQTKQPATELRLTAAGNANPDKKVINRKIIEKDTLVPVKSSRGISKIRYKNNRRKSANKTNRPRRMKKPPVLQFEPLYKKAVALFYRQHYSESINILRSLLQFNPRHPLAGQAQHWLGDAYFATGAYLQAVIEYEKVAMFPHSPKVEEAKLMVGIALFRAGKNTMAEEEFMRVLETRGRQSVLATAQRYLRKIDRA